MAGVAASPDGWRQQTYKLYSNLFRLDNSLFRNIGDGVPNSII